MGLPVGFNNAAAAFTWGDSTCGCGRCGMMDACVRSPVHLLFCRIASWLVHPPSAAGNGVRSAIRSRGMPVALSAAIFCARSRASLASWAQGAVA